MDTRVELLRQLLEWCGEFNQESFKDTPSFITAMMPLVNQEPDEGWEKRVQEAAMVWATSAKSIGYVEVAPDLDLYSMFQRAVWAVHEGDWDTVAEFFSDD